MTAPRIVTAQEWQDEWERLLVKEKELTRAQDALAAQRRRMPWLPVEKQYTFEGPEGRMTLLDLFEGRRQLIVYRAFFDPGVHGAPEGTAGVDLGKACFGCSMMADHIGNLAHVNARSTTFVFASRAPQPDIARLKKRMDWTMPWYTITDTFDTDFGVDEWHGTNAFIRVDSQIFRTYFLTTRGDSALGNTWTLLDITALGRQETWEDSPPDYPQSPPYAWWHRHDEYPDSPPSPADTWNPPLPPSP
ncbi:DUF899 domain-containing protein [Nocardia sp. ET3-3]|uniref:DUF899 domain-containing protein n=1 Tax=Nocardia terrae TaxID=2675851 RepID=A0A7K1URL9_9NOCA|nr:DUF899 domain-containing protein [Nocardia terrae]MVU76990.1 DUF899 domain-containing protein [Nocardia terrae]